MTPLRTPMLFLALVLALPHEARALKIDVKKKYEEELIRWALEKAGLEREPDPAGKVIERIEIVRENIIAPTDPWPNFFNWVHVKTRDFVVRQEMLVEQGRIWDEARVEESMRNLRELFILAVARAVPCRSRSPGKVVLLVVTKDLWSLRINMVFGQVGTVLQSFEAFPTEHNFLGRNKRLGLHFRVRQLDWSEGTIRNDLLLGQLYVDPRVWGSRIQLIEQLDLIMSGDVPCAGAMGGTDQIWCPGKATGDVEGAYGLLRVRRPLFALDTRWGFDAWAEADIRQVRLYRYNSTPRRGERAGVSLRTDALPGDFGAPAVPRVYDARVIHGQASYTRSFGSQIKKSITGGAGAYTRRFEHPDDFPFPEEVLAWHASNYLPRSEDATYLYVGGRTYSPRYVRLLDIQGFALSEDFVLGHDVTLQLQAAANVQDAGQSYLFGLLSAQYTWYFGGDLLSLWLEASSRLQPGLRDLLGSDRDYDGPWANTFLELAARNVSPPLWVGRLHLRALLRARHNDLDRRRLFLGGNPATDQTQPVFRRYEPVLRGYAADQFEGDGLLSLNVEYRTRPLNLWTLHLGLVAFYDGGGVFGGPDPLDPSEELAFRYHHSVGVGVRGHFPQFDKESLRIDFAIPLTDARGDISTWFSLSFRQVF